MAELVVVDKEQLENDLTVVADAIREKGETTEQLAFPQGMKQAVKAIEKGIVPSGTVQITENGMHDVTDYANAEVNVAGSNDDVWIEDDSPVVYEKTCYQNGNVSLLVTENGTATYRRTLREGENGYYANHHPNWSYNNFNALSGTHGVFSNKILSVVQAEIVDVENATDVELIKEIGNSTFALMSNLKRISIPNNIETVGNYAFSRCGNLKKIDLPDTVSSMGVSLFDYCFSLESFEIPPLITSLGSSMFSNCWGLKNVYGIERMISIGANAFDFCVNLQGSIILNEAITDITNYTFRCCYSLVEVRFLGTPTGTIGASAFGYCPLISNIYVPWAEGEVANAPWGASNATIHYNTTYDDDHNPIV